MPINGTNGNDTLFDTAGDDTINGLDGNDTITVTNGNDSANGGNDLDTLVVNYGGATVGILGGFNNFAPSPQTTFGVGFTGFERFDVTTGSGADSIQIAFLDGHDSISTGAGDDFILTNSGDDIANGGADHDLIDVGTGDDTADGGTGNDRISADMTGAVSGIVWNLQTNSYSGPIGSFTNFEYFGVASTGKGNDVVVTGTGNFGDTVNLGDGNDSVTVVAGNDSVNGGSDFDTLIVNYGGATAAISGGFNTFAAGAIVGVAFTQFERFLVTTGSGNDTIQIAFFGGNDIVSTGPGVDHLETNSGNDTLDGGAGADTMVGGPDNDKYIVDNSGDLVVEAAGGGTDSISTLVDYTLGAGEHVERLNSISFALTSPLKLTGNNFVNLIEGNAGNNTLDGRGGVDTMVGFGGDDKYVVDNAGDVVTEGAGGGTDSISAIVDYQLAIGSHVERLNAISFVLTTPLKLTGNNFVNLIEGNAGDNVLDGRGGADTMVGFGGNDKFVVDNAGDVVTEGAGGGTDSISAIVDYTLAAGVHVERLNAISAALTSPLKLTGNELVNRIEGNAGNNTLDGKGGADVLIGFGGADSFAFTSALGGGNIDVVDGFVAGTDKIALDDAIFAIGAALDGGEFQIGAAAADATDRIIYNSATGQLFYDADGVGGAAQVQFATVTGAPALTVSDFAVI